MPKALYPNQATLHKMCYYNPENPALPLVRKTTNKPLGGVHYIYGKPIARYRHHYRGTMQISRLVWIYFTGENPEGKIYHADKNVLNNIWENLVTLYKGKKYFLRDMLSGEQVQVQQAEYGGNSEIEEESNAEGEFSTEEEISAEEENSEWDERYVSRPVTREEIEEAEREVAEANAEAEREEREAREQSLRATSEMDEEVYRQFGKRNILDVTDDEIQEIREREIRSKFLKYRNQTQLMKELLGVNVRVDEDDDAIPL
jgi:hypothetical protein